jgi:Tol biopolymer transport system component/predicted Ser/Thr protein kinase
MKKLLHYEILHLIGKGGMGDVYAAEDTKLGRKVALKILPSEMAADPERRARFDREAKAVAALNHPNIVTIHSVEEADGVHFITMELVEGKTLSELIPKSGCPLSSLLDRAVAMIDAVSAAHRRGITHRDLKPDNVMVTGDGRVKVLDFGLAKLKSEGTDDIAATRLAADAQTAEGKILGTVAYMSPEQAEGKPVDPRSDVFSLGIILYEMATGRRPFNGDTPVSTLSSILKDTPSSVTELNKALPRHLGRIVKRCLTKDPNRRYQTAVDLRNDLEGLKEEVESGDILLEGAVAGTSAGRFKGRRLAVGVAVLAVAVIGIGYGLHRFVSLRAGDPGTTATFQQMEMTRLTGKKGSYSSPAISPDGKYVVHVQEDEGEDSLWLLQISTASRVQIVPPSDAHLWGPAFSPDGDFIYYVRSMSDADFGTLYRVPVLGGPSKPVIEDVDGRVSFSPDGSRFVFLRSEGIQRDMLVVADVDGGNVREIASRTLPEEYHRNPAWSPDGRVVAVAALTRSDSDEYSLVEVPSEGGDERTISSRAWGHIENPAWLPDGSGLVISEAFQLWEQPYPEGTARRITNDLNSYYGVSLTTDGKSLVTVLTETDRALWVTSVGEAGEPERITSGSERVYYRGVSCAPDGRIVYGASVGPASGLWITGKDGGKTTQLTSGGLRPSVSVDGRYIVFRSSDSTENHIWRMDLDGGNPVQLTFGDGEDLPQCHPDGRTVLYLGVTSGGYALYRVPLEGGEPVPLVDRTLTGSPPAISPDGTKVAVRFYDEDTDEMLTGIFQIEGGESTRTLELDDDGFRVSLRSSPGGDALDYVVYEEEAANIWSQPLDGGPPRRLTHFEAEHIDDFAWAPDGKTLAVIRRTNTWDVVLLTNFR